MFAIDNEIWKNILGYEGLYKISNLGNVKSLFRYKKILVPVKTRKGYLRVTLCKNKIKTNVLIHRLVAINFIENKNNYPQVNHIDENKENNNVNNLEWCTNKYNHNYGTCHKRASKNTNYSLREKPVLKILNGEVIEKFKSIKDASIELGKFAKSNIISVCKGRYKKAYGYEWKYDRSEN